MMQILFLPHSLLINMFQWCSFYSHSVFDRSPIIILQYLYAGFWNNSKRLHGERKYVCLHGIGKYVRVELMNSFWFEIHTFPLKLLCKVIEITIYCETPVTWKSKLRTLTASCVLRLTEARKLRSFSISAIFSS